jgi:chemotaxis signal transduction protein
MREAGIVLDNRVARDGRVRLYTLHPRRTREILTWLASASGPDYRRATSGRWPKHVVAVRVGQHRFGIVTDEEARLIPALEIVALPLGAKHISGLVEVDGTIVAVLDLGRRMELEPPASVTDQPGCVVVVSIDGSSIAIRVGAAVAAGLLRAADVRAMPSGATATRAEGLVGVARVDGRLTVLVDPAGLMS